MLYTAFLQITFYKIEKILIFSHSIAQNAQQGLIFQMQQNFIFLLSVCKQYDCIAGHGRTLQANM